jgi:hypothetical protein
MLEAIGKADANVLKDLYASRDESQKRLEKIDAELAAKFPEYANLASPRPLTVAETQALLRPDEALVAFLDGPRFGQGRGGGAALRARRFALEHRRGPAGLPGRSQGLGRLRGLRADGVGPAPVRPCPRPCPVQGAPRTRRGHDQGQAPSHRAGGAAACPSACW